MLTCIIYVGVFVAAAAGIDVILAIVARRRIERDVARRGGRVVQIDFDQYESWGHAAHRVIYVDDNGAAHWVICSVTMTGAVQCAADRIIGRPVAA